MLRKRFVNLVPPRWRHNRSEAHWPTLGLFVSMRTIAASGHLVLRFHTGHLQNRLNNAAANFSASQGSRWIWSSCSSTIVCTLVGLMCDGLHTVARNVARPGPCGGSTLALTASSFH